MKKIILAIIFLSFFSVYSQESPNELWYKDRVMLNKADSISSMLIIKSKLDTIIKGDYSSKFIFKNLIGEIGLNDQVSICPVTTQYKKRMERKLIRFGFESRPILTYQEGNKKNGQYIYFDRNKVTAIEIYKNNRLKLRYSLNNKRVLSKIISIYSETQICTKRLSYSYEKGILQSISVYNMIDSSEFVTLEYENYKLHRIQYLFGTSFIKKMQRTYPNSLFLTLIGFEIRYDENGDKKELILLDGDRYNKVIIRGSVGNTPNGTFDKK